MLIQPFLNYNLPDAWYLGECPHHHGELGGQQRQQVDRAGGWGWRGSCSGSASYRSTPSCRPSTMWRGPTSRQTGSCASSSSFSSPSKPADISHQPPATWVGSIRAPASAPTGHHASRNAMAACKSGESQPSVNQPDVSASTSSVSASLRSIRACVVLSVPKSRNN